MQVCASVVAHIKQRRSSLLTHGKMINFDLSAMVWRDTINLLNVAVTKKFTVVSPIPCFPITYSQFKLQLSSFALSSERLKVLVGKIKVECIHVIHGKLLGFFVHLGSQKLTSDFGFQSSRLFLAS